MPELTVPAQVSQLETINSFLEELLEPAGCSMKVINSVLMAVEEAFVNVAHYSGSPDVRLDARIDGGRLSLSISDSGVPYDPLSKNEPDITLSAEERGIGGLGILMYKKLMDGVSYRYEDGRNILVLEKNL